MSMTDPDDDGPPAFDPAAETTAASAEPTQDPEGVEMAVQRPAEANDDVPDGPDGD